MRNDRRTNEEKRPLKITEGYTKYAAGSILIETGDTKVLCTASVEESVPPFLKGKNQGWVTAEYSMLPSATSQRNKRDISKLKQAARSVEIQRLIGRSLRSVVDMEALGERSIVIDCDVLQADGGTRTASITGGFIAMALAMKKLYDEGKIKYFPIDRYLAAISVGIVDGEALCDLNYLEDSVAEVDMNVVMDSNGEFAEIQGTGEGRTYSMDDLDKLLTLAEKGNKELIEAQKRIIGDISSLRHYENINKVLIASGNAGKIHEMKRLLAPLNIDVVSPKDIGLDIEVEETGTTFEENSMIKAKAYMQASGLPAVADDSGLCVDALGGEPGIYSARYCGDNATDQERVSFLLKNMIDADNRHAHFVSAVSFSAPDGRGFTVTGRCDGVITHTPKGENGFGYDPVFYYPEKDMTFAQMSDEEKNQISHRSVAMGQFVKKIKKYV